MPKDFYARVWHTLQKTPGGIFIAGKQLPQQLAINMSLSELNFALEVEKVLHNIEHPEYIQIVIQVITISSNVYH